MSKVILIEDSEPFANVLRVLLEPVKVLMAHDMATAQALIKQAGPEDTILVDLSLPDSAPCRTLSQIAAWKCQDRPPRVVVMTGLYDQNVLEQAKMIGDAFAWKHDRRGLFNVLKDIGVFNPNHRGTCANEETVKEIEETVAHLVA